MKIEFIGADHEVTGSCHFIEVSGKKLLLDCGMEQGPDIYENATLPVEPADIDYIFLSHAHIDHSGLIPLMYKNGFKGKIYATYPTCDLCSVMLKDSAHIQEFEAKWRNRKNKRSGEKEYVPIYTMDDACGAIELFEPCEYKKRIKICDEIEVEFVDVGHLLGSSAIKLWLSEAGVTKELVFSGDIGNTDQPIIKDPEYIDSADYLLIESTYGNRVHDKVLDYVEAFKDILQETFDKGGNVVIPSFAVGRTQEILYFIREIKEKNLIKNHDGFEVYIDSPLAIEATTIFDKNGTRCYDEKAMELVNNGIKPFIFDGLKVATTPADSMAINSDTKPKVIISASGMCEAGRIRHHLKHNLWRSESTILFVGYQAVNTLGRRLIEGEEKVRIFGEEIKVNARIEKIAGISGHADMNGLLRFVDEFQKKPEMVFVVHGEDSVTDYFAKLITQKFNIKAIAPYSGGEYDLLNNKIISLGNPKKITKQDNSIKTRVSGAYAKLLSSLDRLKRVVDNMAGHANKDIEKMSSEIDSLSDKWE